MSSPYNPNNRTDNCGFCAISYALHVQKHIDVDADALYLQTLARLGLAYTAGKDPIPRMLIFPAPRLEETAAVRTEYSALEGGVHGLSSYTITSVAEDFGLRFQPSITALELPRQFMAHYSTRTPGIWNIRDFEEKHLDYLKSRGLNPKLEDVRKYIAKELGGHSILGSKTRKHYMNVFIDIDRTGKIEAFDAQDGLKYDGRGLNSRLGSVDLVMHLQ
jgi:hypothetical protein